MRYTNKVKTIEQALAPLRSGMRLMLGEFVGAGEAARCIEALLASDVRELTLIANTPGLRGGFLAFRCAKSFRMRHSTTCARRQRRLSRSRPRSVRSHREARLVDTH